MKKNYSMFAVTCFFILLLFSNCSTEKLDRLLRMKDKGYGPKWDLKAKLPVLEKKIYLKDYMKNKTLDPWETTGVQALPVWPVDTLREEDISGKVSIADGMKIDFNTDDSHDNDLKIYGLYSNDANCFIDVWLTRASDSQILGIQSSDIAFTSVNIEGHVYSGAYYSSENNTVTYRLNDFPLASEGYFINFAGDAAHDVDNCNFDNLIVDLMPGAPVYTGDFYIVHIRARLVLGENFSVAASIINDSDIKTDQNISIPIKDLPYKKLDKFRFNYDFNSTIPFVLNMTNRIRTNDNSFIQDEIFNISSGKLDYQPHNNYYFVAANGESSESFSLNSFFFGRSDVVMDYTISVNASNDILLLSTDGELSFQAAVECGGELNF